MRRNATIGSISTGTLLSVDLLDAFSTELEWLAGDEPTESEVDLLDAANSLLDSARHWQDVQEEEAAQLVNDLQDALSDLAPPYFYFGAHPGDGADFGFWLQEDFESEFDGLKVSDTSEVPADYCGEVLHVNDHGNATLYAKDEGSSELREVWAVV